LRNLHLFKLSFPSYNITTYGGTDRRTDRRGTMRNADS